jgi:hypothetical protein
LLRTAPGDIRKTISAAAALAVVALMASCTGGSSGGDSAKGSPSPTVVSSSPTPDTLVNDSLVTLPATAVIQVGNSSSSTTLHTKASQPLQLQVTPAGAVTVTLAMTGSGSQAFSVEGAARTGGSVTDDHVVIFLSDGTLIDTVQGNPCTASYDVLSAKKVSATFRCLTREGAAKVPVTVKLSASA